MRVKLEDFNIRLHDGFNKEETCLRKKLEPIKIELETLTPRLRLGKETNLDEIFYHPDKIKRLESIQAKIRTIESQYLRNLKALVNAQSLTIEKKIKCVVKRPKFSKELYDLCDSHLHKYKSHRLIHHTLNKLTSDAESKLKPLESKIREICPKSPYYYVQLQEPDDAKQERKRQLEKIQAVIKQVSHEFVVFSKTLTMTIKKEFNAKLKLSFTPPLMSKVASLCESYLSQQA